MWHCIECGSVFYEPKKRIWRENMDGELGWMEWTETTCPFCGSDMIEERQYEADL